MESYEALAASYDELTEDVAYEKRADFVEKLFLRAKRPVKSLLDLACGTGSLSEEFAKMGAAAMRSRASTIRPRCSPRRSKSSPRSIRRRCFCASRCRS